jgi:hypothetical protein
MYKKDKDGKDTADLITFDGRWTLDDRVQDIMEKGNKLPEKAMMDHVKANGGGSIPSSAYPVPDLEKEPTEKDGKLYWVEWKPKTSDKNVEYEETTPFQPYDKKKEKKQTIKWSPKESESDSNLIIGLCLIAVHLFLHAWGSWFGEKALKKGKNVPYLMQKATEMSLGLVACLLQLLVVFPFMPKEGVLKDLRDDAIYNNRMWNGWETVGLWSYFVVFCCRHFIAGIIVKNLNTIVKQVASNGSFMIVYFVSLWWAGIEVESRAWTPYRLHANTDAGNKFGINYTEKINFISGSTDFSKDLFTLLIMVTAICLGWAIVSKYTKCKNNWKKLYNELKESEDALNAPDAAEMHEQGEEGETAPLVGEGQTLPPPQ